MNAAAVLPGGDGVRFPNGTRRPDQSFGEYDDVQKSHLAVSKPFVPQSMDQVGFRGRRDARWKAFAEGILI